MTDDRPPLWDAALDSDRKRGFLTQRDRAYLLGDREVDGQPERDLRYRIRNRVKNGLLDVVVLDAYSDDELEKIIASADYPPDGLIVLLYSLAYRLLSISYGSLLGSDTRSDDLSDVMSDMLEHSIHRIERHREGVVEVTVDIDIDRIEVEEDLLLNRIVGGNATVEEMWTYIRSHDVSRLVSRLEAEGKEDAIIVKMDYLREIAEEENDE